MFFGEQQQEQNGRRRQEAAEGGGRGGGGWNQVTEIFYGIPLITRSFLVGCLLTTLAVHLNLVSPIKLYLRTLPQIAARHEYWRFLTNFFFFDYLGLNFLLHMFFLVRYCKFLEQGSFRNRPADFLWFVLFCAISLLGVNYLLHYFALISRPFFFLAPALAHAIVYLWGRRNPHMSILFLGVTFSAPWLAWVILGLSWLMGGSPALDLLGIAVGHLYFFFADVYPLFTGRHLLKTPSIIQYLFRGEVE